MREKSEQKWKENEMVTYYLSDCNNVNITWKTTVYLKIVCMLKFRILFPE